MRPSSRTCGLYLLALLLAAPQDFLPAADNVAPEGFTALFNGKDLSGWKGLVESPPARAKMSAEDLARAQAAADERMRQHWSVVDGVIVFDGKGDSLCTAKDWGDFELLVDWKIEKDGDSGIYVRGSPQIQIWDRPEGSGGLYNNQKNPSKALVCADRPVREWNSFRIRMVGEKVTVHLNGVLVVDDTTLENYWERDKPIYPTGQIELQNHGNSLYFKNIYIRDLSGTAPVAGKCVLAKGQRVAVVGDSITEQKLYSRFIEDYLVACLPDLDLKVVQLGWGGERAGGFASRMANDLLPFRPAVVTTCYGMNDGQYRAYEPSIGETYAKSMEEIVDRLLAAGAVVVVGGPGAVDTTTFRNPSTPPKVYNENLAQLGSLARGIAKKHGLPFADVNGALIAAMAKAKAKFGEAYDVCGGDGVHPQANGHLVMAYAFLVAMGLDGDLGSISLEWKGKAQGAGGHTVLALEGGKIQVESRRYPFSFQGDEKSPASTRSILPFVPFQEELNRFTLKVTGLPSARARVTWGKETKSFAREDLARGINLAAEFLENPFSEPFRKVDELVAKKQAYETLMIKETIHRFRLLGDLLPGDAEAAGAIAKLREKLEGRWASLALEVREAVQPVQHTILVEAE